MKKYSLAVMLGVGLSVATLALALDDVATCAITATVDEIVEWDGDVTIAAGDFSAHITSAKDTTGITASVAMTLYFNVDVNIVASDAVNSGVLTAITGIGPYDTLTTTYQMTGADMTNPDGAYIASGTFIGKSYAQTHAAGDGDCVITLGVKAATEASGAGACPDADDYSTTITLTATKP